MRRQQLGVLALVVQCHVAKRIHSGGDDLSGGARDAQETACEISRGAVRRPQ
jgi:hypothetical protein